MDGRLKGGHDGFGVKALAAPEASRMSKLQSSISATSAAFKSNAQAMAALVAPLKSKTETATLCAKPRL
ncbi:MAG TPA: hypothetical protein VHW02_04625 [Rhizomicrobium sp.]|jgi:hypothetical protein|nr:hypothetical protein [Rhizomicrobium sp.]